MYARNTESGCNTVMSFSTTDVISMNVRGCLHDNGATFIPGRDEKLHRVYIKPCLLGCESYSAVKLMKL